METASLWTTLFNSAGANLLCPFLDSRLIRVAVNIEPRDRYSYRQPKKVLKQALRRHASRKLVYRKKLGFGQPIFEWMSQGGQLRPLVDAIGTYDFVNPEVLQEARAHPNWFLYSLLCYDLWFKLFIEKTVPLTAEGGPDVTLPATRS
jgi:asparagine synthetase B (glutamine-hydrolysing)